MALAGILVLALTVAAAANVARADDTPPSPPSRSFALIVAEWQRTLAAAEAFAKTASFASEEQSTYLVALARVLKEAQAAVKESQGQIDEQGRLREALGPEPAADQAAEPREIVRQRKDIDETIAFYRARLAQAELAAARAHEAQEALAAAARQMFVLRLLERTDSPLQPTILIAGLTGLRTQLPLAAQSVATSLASIMTGVAQGAEGRQFEVPLLLAGTAIIGLLIRRGLRRRFGQDPAILDPSEGRRVATAAATALGDALPVVLPLAMLAWFGKLAAAQQDGGPSVVQTVFVLALLWTAVMLAHSVLVPPAANWSPVPRRVDQGKALFWLIAILCFLIAADSILRGYVTAMSPATKALPVYNLAITAVTAGWLVLVVRRGFYAFSGREAVSPAASAAADASVPPVYKAAATTVLHGEAGGPVDRRTGRGVVQFYTVVAVGCTVAAAAGYGMLGSYAIRNLALSTLIIAALLILRAWGHVAFARGISAAPEGLQRQGDGDGISTSFWLRLMFDGVLALAGLYVIAWPWGVPTAELGLIRSWLMQGIQVGGVRVAITDVAAALVTLIVGLFATRAVRRMLASRVLPSTGLHRSIQESIAVGFGYLGSTLALLLAIAVLGINLSSIAIVAGALSVGIGFGLQNIVNNFVSGLILLIERPVKVGDWVIVGDKQGYVRRINVRSTEIETFERSTVIVPNSDLLSQPVTNLTHKDQVGRVDVRVGVAYGTDTDKVRRVLLACARAHPLIADEPQPIVLFLDFGASSLDFELRAFLHNVQKHPVVGSELRFAIEQAFRENGIEFPYPQVDVHLKDVEQITGVLQQARGGIGQRRGGVLPGP
jgi:small-conductance mechanosensitive channel